MTSVIVKECVSICFLTFYSGWPKVCHNAMTMPESREAHRK